ncbi:ParA family protein [Roseomonas sp. BN140053]|uniref:ParA family protein n=1 Tax=Roseomonas sp. BN140053 TaxID=3391898 RepID=UPI0039E746F5
MESEVGHIVTVASGKGGCSKTSLVTLLSGNLAAAGYRVAVIDADPNASYHQWHQLYEGPEINCFCEIRHEEIVDAAQGRAESYDVVLIDTAGFGNTTAAFAAGTADLVLIPIMPDRASAVEAMRTARQVQAFGKAGRREIPFRIVRSRWNPRGLVERAVGADLTEAGLPLIEQHLSDLSDFGKLSLTGKVPTSGKVGEQAMGIIKEMIGLGAVPAAPAKVAA